MSLKYLAGDLRFPSGVVYLEDGSLIIAEMSASRIIQLSPNGDIKVLAETGGGPEGIQISPTGELYICNNGGYNWSEVDGITVPGEEPVSYSGGRIQVLDLYNGELSTLYRTVDGHLLASPSDLTFDSSGGFWFVDRGKTRLRSRDRGGLYYAKCDGSSVKEIVYPLDSPSGVTLSSDEKTLYVAESMQGRIYSWKLSEPGKIAGYFGSQHRGELFADPEGGYIFNSLKLSPHRYLTATSSGNSGLITFTPDGSRFVSKLDDPIVGNVCYNTDHKVLYVTLSGTGSVVEITLNSLGLPALS